MAKSFPRPEHPLTEHLDFTYSSFGKPKIAETEIKLPVREFSVSKGFPGHERGVIYSQGTLVFEGVFSSVRTISEYETPEGKSFKATYTITDGPFAEVHDETYLFYVGGFSYDPHGWVEWDILAVNVRIEGGEVNKVFD